jgi:hypothetical protein
MIAAAAILSASLLPAQTPTPPPDIDRYVAQVMAAFEIPGIARSYLPWPRGSGFTMNGWV